MTGSDDGSSWPQVGVNSAKSDSIEGWWKGELAPPTRGRRLEHVASSPAAVGRWITYVSRDRRLVLCDHRTGQQVWDADVGKETYWTDRASYDVFTMGQAGRIAPAPTVAGEVVCVRSSQDFVLRGFALDTGRELWSAATDDSMLDAALTVADDVVLVGDVVGRFYAFNAASGTLRWAVSLGEEGIERPAATADGIAFVPVGDGVVHAIDIRRGKVLWPAVTGGYMSAFVSVSGDTLLAASGTRLLGIDAKTGERRWRRRFRSMIGGLAIGAGSGVASGQSAVYAVSVADGAVRWERELDGTVGAPSIAGDVIFVAATGPDRLCALSLVDGRVLWHVELESSAVGTPVPLPGRVLLPVDGGILDVWRFDRRSDRHPQSTA